MLISTKDIWCRCIIYACCLSKIFSCIKPFVSYYVRYVQYGTDLLVVQSSGPRSNLHVAIFLNRKTTSRLPTPCVLQGCNLTLG